MISTDFIKPYKISSQEGLEGDRCQPANFPLTFGKFPIAQYLCLLGSALLFNVIMTKILTILGHAGLENHILAIAAARRSAAAGERVLLVSHDRSPVLGMLLDCSLTGDLQAIETRFWVQSLQSTRLLEKSWEELRNLEAQYLRTPFFKSVYGQELSILPGMDSALALNALREFAQSGQYDLVIFAGANSAETLRMLGMPAVLSWYVRRFRQVFLESDFAKVALPFVQPFVAAVSTVNWSDTVLAEPADRMTGLLEKGSLAVSDPDQVFAYLSTGIDPFTIATAKNLWGMAQQIGLTIAGVLTYQSRSQVLPSAVQETFAPLGVSSIALDVNQPIPWDTLQAALPSFTQALEAPRSLTIDVAQRQVKLFLPGFEKKQVKLTQYGQELTIEAGDQRRNIDLPPELTGKPVAAAKFQDHYLIITIG